MEQNCCNVHKEQPRQNVQTAGALPVHPLKCDLLGCRSGGWLVVDEGASSSCGLAGVGQGGNARILGCRPRHPVIGSQDDRGDQLSQGFALLPLKSHFSLALQYANLPIIVIIDPSYTPGIGQHWREDSRNSILICRLKFR